ncbi:MAG: hypothetical protein RR685_10195 [Hungatella sp.]
MKVKEMRLGNCIVEIYDDYVVKTEEERKECLDRVGKIVSGCLKSQKEETA